MTIFVYDSGKPKQKYSTLLFNCKIDDVNDNAPIIDKIITRDGRAVAFSLDASSYHDNATIRIKNVNSNKSFSTHFI